ncbi:hypothetical protein BDV12DRAFT_209773 [Aspergillus spectabilis]
MSNTQQLLTKPTTNIKPITDPKDFHRFFSIAASTFGRQTKDGIWIAFNPGWDTPAGKEKGIARLIDRWNATTFDRNGNSNTVFLKATVSGENGEEEIAGVAIWVQASNLDGYGEKPITNFAQAVDLEDFYPGDAAEQRYMCQLDASLHRRRFEVVSEIAASSSPAVMVLDLCVVDPAFQRRGVASKLVQWGLDEARRRGGLEAVLEASAMGRHIYAKLGFVQDGGECEYVVDEEFAGRERPSNIFMRTGPLI